MTEAIEDDLDPEIRVFVRRVNEAYARLIGERRLSLAERRAVAEEVRQPWAAGGPVMASTKEVTLEPDGLRVRIYRPTDEHPLPTLLYAHGGGWTVFSLDTHDRLMREYAARSGCAVVGVDYSLAPEARFPRALDEIVLAARWILRFGSEYGLDNERLALGGDSAGGNLALAGALRLRDEGGPAPRALLLNYAALDTEVRPSYEQFSGDDYNLTAGEMAAFWDNYLGDALGAHDPYAVPLRADLRGLPPCFLCIAACDVLLDENLELARLLRDAGVEVRGEIYQGATHSFLEAMSISQLSRRALSDASQWLARKLAA